MVIIWKFSHAEITSAIIGSLLATNCNFYNKKRENKCDFTFVLLVWKYERALECLLCLYLTFNATPTEEEKKRNENLESSKKKILIRLCQGQNFHTPLLLCLVHAVFLQLCFLIQ